MNAYKLSFKILPIYCKKFLPDIKAPFNLEDMIDDSFASAFYHRFLHAMRSHAESS